MKNYEYLIAYLFQKEGYLGPCFGTSSVLRTKKIASYADIREIQELLIKQVDGASNLSIYNFILLGKCKVNYGKDIDN